MKKKIPVIIDCDPGADDALGILLALYSGCISVQGITSVCGNAPSLQTARNATKMLHLFGTETIRVYCGANQPMERTLAFSTTYSGADGLCDTGLKEQPSLLAEKSAKEYLVETLKNTAEPITIVATAGFTNLAEALREDPDIASGIREIVAASGYFGLNQKESRAEWNILVDPEAAKVVYASGIPVRAIGLDVSCMVEDASVELLLADANGKVGDFLKGCNQYNKKMGLRPYSLLVDGMAMAATIEPDIAMYQTGRVIMHPERNDAGLMEFQAGEGTVRAAYQFDLPRYFNMLKGIVEK